MAKSKICIECGKEFNGARNSRVCKDCEPNRNIPEFNWDGPSSEELHEEARKAKIAEVIAYSKQRYQNDNDYRRKMIEKVGYKHQLWAHDVKVRDEVCQVCGSSHQLEAHHVVPKAQVPSKKYDVDNGILLCRDCHRSGEHSIHRQLGVNYSPVEFGVWFSVCKSLINR